MIEHLNDVQLEFELDLDEVSDDAKERRISVKEARQISEGALQALRVQIETAEGIVTWFQDYLRLLEMRWPWRVACYIAWASSPKVGRWPETLTSLATQVLGLISPRVIYTWRKKYPAIDSVVAMMQAAPLWEHRREVIEALIKVASMPDYKGHQDRELFLKLTGDFVDKRELDIGAASKSHIEGKQDAELRAWLTGEFDDQEENTGDTGDSHTVVDD